MKGIGTMVHPLQTMSRERKFLETYAKTKDAATAANETWPEVPPRRRIALAKRTLDQPEVRRALDKFGLGLSKLMKKHQSLLDSKKTINMNGIIVEIENAEVQARMVELGYKMHGLLKSTDAPPPQQVQVTIDPGKLAEVAARLEKINAKMLPHVNISSPPPMDTTNAVDATTV